MGRPLRMLIVQDSEDDTLLVARELRRGGYDVTFERVETAEAMKAALDRQAWDLVIADYVMQRFSAPAALKLLQQRGPDLPFLIVSGTIGEDVAVEAMRAGVHDYFLKDNLTRLAAAVERELGEVEERRQRKEAEEALREHVDNLGERVKELSCLYGISDILLKPGILSPQDLQRVVDLIPPGWQYPEITCARITLEGQEYKTANFKETGWKQASDIVLQGETPGAVEVYYLEEKPECDEGPFLKEERALIDAIAAHLGQATSRERAQKALRESENKYRRLLENLPQKIFLKDRNSVYVSCNDNYAQDLGIGADDIPGKTDYDFYPKQLADKYRADDRRIIESGQTEDIEEPYIQDGKKIWVHTMKTRVHDENGNVLGILGIFWDITEQKRAEERIADLNAVLRAIRNVNQLIVREKDRDRLLKGACNNLVEARGYYNAWIALMDESGKLVTTAEAGLGDDFLPLVEGLKGGQLPHCARRALSEPRVLTIEDPHSICGDCPLAGMYAERAGMACRLESAGNIYGLLSVSVSPDYLTDQDEQSLFAEVAADIAFGLRNIDLERERKRTEEALRLAASQWQDTFDATEEMIAIIDRDNRIVRANRAMKMAFENTTVTGALCCELVHGSDHPIEGCVTLAAFETGKSAHLEIREDHLGGRWLDIAGSPIKDESGNVQQVVHLMRDITERKRLEEQLGQVAKLESIGRLAGGVAHDFNNILTGIIGYTQLLVEQVGEDSPAGHDLTQIRELADRATALTRQLLAFSRRQTLEPVVLNINNLVENTSKMLGRIIGEDIDLQFSPGEDLGNVRADSAQIEQVLMNLAVNARDAMPRGGKLTIETGNVVLDQDYAGSHVGVKPGRYVMLAVTDTGCGIEEEALPHIFEPFFTTKEIGKGTGLGLSTVYGIVKQHGGNIWVYSEQDKGTTFKVYLPRVDADADELRKREEIKPMGGNETILLVEDEKAVRDLATRILQDRGYTVLTAASPPEAECVLGLHSGDVALLLTDVVLPEGGGLELYEHMVRDRPSLKVLYMSGYTDNSIAHRGILKPGTNFIQKPFTPDDLARKVREVLDAAKQAKG